MEALITDEEARKSGNQEGHSILLGGGMAFSTIDTTCLHSSPDFLNSYIPAFLINIAFYSLAVGTITVSDQSLNSYAALHARPSYRPIRASLTEKMRPSGSTFCAILAPKLSIGG